MVIPLSFNEEWWYTVFRKKIAKATDTELPALYEKLYQNYLYKNKNHPPLYEVKPLFIDDKGILRFSDVCNNHNFVRFLMRDYVKGASVLELGCGTSSFPFILVTDGAKVHAIDIRQKVIKHIRKFTRLLPNEFQQNITFDCALAENLPYENNFFDIVIGIDFIEHMRSLDRLMSEVVRVLRPSGRVYFTAPIEGLGWSPEHLQNLDEEKLRNLFSRHGFEVTIYLERRRWKFLKPNVYIVEAKTKDKGKNNV